MVRCSCAVDRYNLWTVHKDPCACREAGMANCKLNSVNTASAHAGSGCSFPELPFQVYLADAHSPDEINPPKSTGQVERCL